MIDYNTLKNNELKNICKLLKLKKYHKLNKSNLSHLLKREVSCRKIQKFFKSKKDICPISLDTIKTLFIFTTKNGAKIKYDAVSLVDYLTKTGDFRDPLSREEITDDNINTLHKILDKKQIMRTSLFHIKKSGIYKRNLEQHNLLIGIENEMGRYIEIIQEMLNSINTIRYYLNDLTHLPGIETEITCANELEYRYKLQIFTYIPQIKNYINQMNYINNDFCKNSLRDAISVINNTPYQNVFNDNTATGLLKKDIVDELIYELNKL